MIKRRPVQHMWVCGDDGKCDIEGCEYMSMDWIHDPPWDLPKPRRKSEIKKDIEDLKKNENP